MLKKIISGGQSGVDRGSLDAAIDNYFGYGGCCTKNRKAEDGYISETKYKNLIAINSNNYQDRTAKNIAESDGTLILHDAGCLTGGTALTRKLCNQLGKPYFTLSKQVFDECAKLNATWGLASNDDKDNKLCKLKTMILDFIKNKNIETLNVAGPRLSKWPGGYKFSYEIVRDIILSV